MTNFNTKGNFYFYGSILVILILAVQCLNSCSTARAVLGSKDRAVRLANTVDEATAEVLEEEMDEAEKKAEKKLSKGQIKETIRGAIKQDK